MLFCKHMSCFCEYIYAVFNDQSFNNMLTLVLLNKDAMPKKNKKKKKKDAMPTSNFQPIG